MPSLGSRIFLLRNIPAPGHVDLGDDVLRAGDDLDLVPDGRDCDAAGGVLQYIRWAGQRCVAVNVLTGRDERSCLFGTTLRPY